MLDRIAGTGRWLRIVCAVALLCIGFAHTPPSPGSSQPSSLELSQYAFPDGTLPVLCLPDNDEGGFGGGMSGKGCEACRLTADLVVPTPDGSMAHWLPPRIEQGVPPLRFEAFRRQPVPPNASPRAPPVLLIA